MANLTANASETRVALDDPLPEMPAWVLADSCIAETWNFVNRLYNELNFARPDQRNLRKKLLRSIAPFVILGLRYLLLRCANVMSKEDSAEQAGKTGQGNARALEWKTILDTIKVRIVAWTDDMSKEKLSGNDPRNNHCVLELISRYKAHHPDTWWVQLAQDRAAIYLEAMRGWEKTYIGPPPVGMMADTNSGGLTAWMHIATIYTLLLRYAEELSDVAELSDLRKNSWGCLRDVELMLRSYGEEINPRAPFKKFAGTK